MTLTESINERRLRDQNEYELAREVISNISTEVGFFISNGWILDFGSHYRYVLYCIRSKPVFLIYIKQELSLLVVTFDNCSKFQDLLKSCRLYEHPQNFRCKAHVEKFLQKLQGYIFQFQTNNTFGLKTVAKLDLKDPLSLVIARKIIKEEPHYWTSQAWFQ